MTNAVLTTEEKETMTEAKRAYNKSETRRFALIFPLDLDGYVNVQYGKESLSPYALKKMNHPYQLGLGETISICRFLMLHEMDVIPGTGGYGSTEFTETEFVKVSEKDKGVLTVAEFMASLDK